jgi:glutaminyl-tRNA synthetase
VQWLIAGWADHCLGFKPKGAHPAKVTSNGQPDYYLAPVAPGAGSEAFFASDYFDQLYEYAVELIRRGKAYVCDLSPEDTEKYRGSPDTPGKDSPFRNRSVAENLDLFTRMKAGEFPDGARSLRSKIDMASPNMWLRDPLLYRIRHVAHHHAGDKWCIYPLYDYAHCLSDYLEGITHSICTLEFVDHRALYDWVLEALGLPRALPHQYEFAKLNLAYTLVSKRKLLTLVTEKVVTGWDDPRMPTLSGLRRRGIPASALRAFVTGVGVTKFDSLTEAAVFENAVRGELNTTAARRLAVLKPIKLVLTNIAAGETVECMATNNPSGREPDDAPGRADPRGVHRDRRFRRGAAAEIFPPEARRRGAPEIRLHHQVRRAREGRQRRPHRDTLHGAARHPPRPAQRRQEGQGHHPLGQRHAVHRRRGAPLRPPLHRRRTRRRGGFPQGREPKSLEVVTAKLEASLATAKADGRYQFERLGYFSLDAKDHAPGKPVFNRTITLKDTWAK